MRRPGSEGIWYVVALPVCSRFQMVEGDVAYRRLWNQATRDTMLDAGAAWTSLIALNLSFLAAGTATAGFLVPYP